MKVNVYIRKPAPDGRSVTCTFPLKDEEVLIVETSIEDLMNPLSWIKRVKEFGYLVEQTELRPSDAPKKITLGTHKKSVTYGLYTEDEFDDALFLLENEPEEEVSEAPKVANKKVSKKKAVKKDDEAA